MIAGTEFLEALDAAVYTTDAAGRITFYNSAAAKLWGRKPDLGELWCGSWRIYRPDGEPLPHDQCPMAIALKEGRPVRDVDAVAERPDGSRVPFMPFPTPIFDDQGKVSGAINLLVDLTGIREAEELRARLAAIVESSDDAIVGKRLDGRVISWNAGAERLFGYAAEEMIGEHITKIIPPELRGEEAEILAQLRQGRRINHYETVRVAKDGRRIDISLTVSPIRDSNGVVIGASKTARDITERKRAEQTQRLLMNELTHRVKNTLATVDAIARQTLRRARSPEDFVVGFSGRVQALARAHSLLTAATFRGADVADLIRDQLMLREESDARIRWSGPEVTLGAQPALHLALVLHELGTNARKHGALSVPGGSIAVDWVVERTSSPTLQIVWRESGGPKVKAPAGAGFGTTLIEQSLRSQGGEAVTEYAESGISCRIVLPLAEDAPLGAARPPLAQVGAGGSAVRSPAVAGKRVLIVEDEPLIAMVAEDYLAEAGYSVVGPAGTIATALGLIAAEDFDAALLDANLGGEGVDKVAHALTGKPFAFVTGYGRDSLPSGFGDRLVVEKPYTQTQLLAAIERLLAPRDGKIMDLKKRA